MAMKLDDVAKSLEKSIQLGLMLAGGWFVLSLAVLITGCRLTDTGSDCHYNYANKFTEQRFKRWQKKLKREGIAPERLQLRWISAAEGKEFAEKLHEMDEVIHSYQIAIAGAP